MAINPFLINQCQTIQYMFKRKTREAYFSFQGCSVAVNPGAKKQREQLAGFPLSCVPQHILAKGQKM